MFGDKEFGSGLFGDAPASPATLPIPVTIQRLKLDCKTNDCTGVVDNNYSIQNAESNPAVVPAAECKENDCAGIAPDFQSYSLDDALYFNGTPVSVVVNCPLGAVCAPGEYPKVITFPPGTFPFPNTPQTRGQPIYLSMQGCQSLVDIFLPADATPAEIQTAVDAIIQQVAQQQAECNEFPTFPFTTTIQLSDLEKSKACLSSVYTGEIASLVTPASYPVTFNVTGGSLPAGMTISSNGVVATITGTPTTLGSSTFTITATAANGATTARAYTITVAGITTTSPLPDATAGEIYSTTISVSGITTPLWGIASGSLPAGLSLSSATGEITGIPTATGSFSFFIFAQNSTSQCIKGFTMFVGVCLITTASPLPSGTQDVAYSTTLAATDITGTLVWSIIAGSLPAGLSLNTATGEISGTPTGVETANFTAQVENGDGNICSKVFELEVEAAGDCPDWSLLTWPAPTINSSGTGSAVTSFVGGVFSVSLSTAAFSGSVNFRGMGCLSNDLLFNVTEETECCIDLSSLASSGGIDAFTFPVWEITVYMNGSPLLDIGSFNGDVAGVYNFTIPAGFSAFSVNVQAGCTTNMSSSDAKSIALTVNMENCT